MYWKPDTLLDSAYLYASDFVFWAREREIPMKKNSNQVKESKFL